MKINNIFYSKSEYKNLSNLPKNYCISFQANPIKEISQKGSKVIQKTLSGLSAIALGCIGAKKNLEKNKTGSDFNNDVEMQEILSKRNDCEEFIDLIKDSYKVNPEVTKLMLNSKDLSGKKYRFSPEVLEMRKLLTTDKEAVIKFLNYKSEGKYRFFNPLGLMEQIIEAYSQNPERVLELVEEKLAQPFEEKYLYDSRELVAQLNAEKINEGLAKRFAEMRFPNGQKRFSGSEVLVLVESYNHNPKVLETMLNETYDGKTPLLLKIERNLLNFTNIIDAFANCPDLPNFIRKFPIISEYSDCIVDIAKAYKKDSEYLKTIFEELDSEKQLPTNFTDLVDAHIRNPKLTEELLQYKFAGSDIGLDYDFINSLVNLQEKDSKMFSQIMNFVDENNHLRVHDSDSLIRYLHYQKDDKEIFNEYINKKDDKGNYIYAVDDIAVISKILKTYRKEDFDYITSQKDFEGNLKRVSLSDVTMLLEMIEKYPEIKKDFFDLLSKKSVSLSLLSRLLCSVGSNRYEKDLSLISKLVDYFEKNKIVPSGLSQDQDGNVEVFEPRCRRLLKFDANANLQLVVETNNIDEKLIEQKIRKYDKEGKFDHAITYTAYMEDDVDGVIGSYCLENVKDFYDKNGTRALRIYTERSKDFPDKLDFVIEKGDGEKIKISNTYKDSNGDMVVEKEMKNKETILTQNYRGNDKERTNRIKITSREGDLLFENKISHRKIDDNHFETVENGIKYAIEYLQDKAIVTRDGKDSIELSIGENGKDSEGVLSRDLLPIIKQLPGSTLFKIKEHGLKRVKLLTSEDIKTMGAQFNSCSTEVGLSERYSDPEKIFVLMHELGHYIDYHSFKEDEEIMQNFIEERKRFNAQSTDMEKELLSYLIYSDSYRVKGLSKELIAETYALLHCTNVSPEVELRGLLLQKYFPRTFEKVAKKLLES